MLVGIVTRTLSVWVEEFKRSCDQLNLKYKLIDIDKGDWIEQVKDTDIIMWRIHLGDKSGLDSAQIKIPLMEKMGIRCFPNSMMASFYENKIKETFFFQIEKYLHPATFISFSQADALEYVKHLSFPVISKTTGGASSSGVFLLKNIQEANKQINKIFNPPTLFARCVNKIIRNLFGKNFIQDELKYVYLQEMRKADYDWRITTMGNGIISVFKRFNRKNDFRASGSGKWGYTNVEELPVEACNIALEISEKNDFSCMAYDFIIDQGESYLIEMSYTFLLNNVYTTTLYKKTENGFIPHPPVSVGVMHLQSMINQ